MLRLRLLASAFSPMLIIFAIRATEHSWVIATALFLAGAIAVLGALLLLAERSLTNAQPFELSAVRDESAQVPAYLLTYLFPFVAVNAEEWQDTAIYVFFAGLIVLVLVRTDLVLVNPVLLLLGYHLYVVDATSKKNLFLISRTRPLVGQTIEAVYLTGGALKLTSVASD